MVAVGRGGGFVGLDVNLLVKIVFTEAFGDGTDLFLAPSVA